MSIPLTLCRFIDPLTDFGFKYLFTAEAHKNIMISFLNAIFHGEKKIRSIEYGVTEAAGNQQMFKKVFFDIKCIADNGEQFIIEMQQQKQLYFKDRCIFYLSRSINRQTTMGKNWQKPLKTVYVIALINFKLSDSESGSYLQDIALMNKNTGKVFFERMGYKFIELPGFNKKEEELQTDLDKWLYILKHMSKLTQLPVSFQEGVFFEIFQLAELNKMSEIELEIYESNLKSYTDYENSITYAKMEAKAEGKAEGILEGEMANKRVIAHQMKQKGFSINQISEITCLPIDEIETIALK
ncbi:Rpn family recombination-promoting nuclease/putative transposase [Pedobacter gandavensis]|uniref:Rpn family recombination-promoting nuclease/putative transposase n=1 Tax=Pedobacter gandavensis TaxID=2679963 RepID=UPI00292E0EE7|nr:Rpn family recombination-promoting nuclease/putative transposase [Pedobacter gandavensis]